MPTDKPVHKGLFIGMTAVDFIYEVAAFPDENSKIMAQRREVCAGGPAANAAATFGFLGGEAVLASAVGSHPIASIIRNDLGRLGVHIADLTPGSSAIPIVASILVTAGTGERTVVSTPGGAVAIDETVLRDLRVEDAAVVLVDGHYMEAAIAVARRARAAGIPVAADGGSWKPRFDELLRNVDAAICSEDFHPPGVSGDESILRWLLDAGPRYAAITHGGDPVRYAISDGHTGEAAVPSVEAVDTLAAGDIFHGAFCWYWANSEKFVECLINAGRVAADSCRGFGPRAWMRELEARSSAAAAGPAGIPSQS